jgi:hypothetical protein
MLTAPAQAAFSTPEEVAPASPFHRGFAAAADASGRLTVATRTPDRAPRLIERRPGGRWSDLPPARGIASGVYKTSLAAAGDDALGVAWWIVQRRDTAIHVAVRDPGGALSDPIEIAGARADGVDHPAIAVDAAGDVLLAYQTGTAASHGRLQGAIAIAYRPAGRSSFIGPMVVDSVPSNPPVVSVARDGTGIVAWTRRSELMAVSVDSRGTIGVARRIARPVLVNRPVLAAGPRSAGSVAYRVNASYDRGKRILQHTSVRVFARPAGGTFGQAQRVFRSPRSGYDLALAADERGRATLAWTDLPSARRDRLGPGRVWAAAGLLHRDEGHASRLALPSLTQSSKRQSRRRSGDGPLHGGATPWLATRVSWPRESIPFRLAWSVCAGAIPLNPPTAARGFYRRARDPRGPRTRGR